MPDSVLCCEPEKNAIIEAIKKATSDDFREKVKVMTNPFGDGNTSEKITSIIRSTFDKYGDIGVVKDFYDIEVNE